MNKLESLKERLGAIFDLNAALALAGWDMQTYMPAGSADGRSYQLATLARIEHELATSDELGRLLEDLSTELAGADPDSDDARLVRVTRKQFDKARRVSAEWVSEFSQVTALAHEAWQRARTTDDWALFRPHLERIVALRRAYAGFFAPYQHVYDPLLDDYEPGLKTAEVQAIFNTLRPPQVDLLRAIQERPQVDDRFLTIEYPEQDQWDFGVEVASAFGFDWEHGRQDRSAHPFTTSFWPGDVRITTRFDPERSASALFSTMHECGHALYEQGFAARFNRTPLASGASMAVHESQSRLWENLVGRSLPFWTHFFPKLQQRFPAQVGNVSLEDFYRGINKVETSLIRVEADEATYNLHIMLRMDLEIALMEGNLEVADLPEAWNAMSAEYLGIRPPNNAAGVLQDVHWSGGSFGYFPTYALGNLVSAQIWEKLHQEIPDLEAQIARGEFAALLAWLREKIHQYGAKFEPQELVERATGSRIDPQPYLRYLTGKYRSIYGL